MIPDFAVFIRHARTMASEPELPILDLWESMVRKNPRISWISLLNTVAAKAGKPEIEVRWFVQRVRDRYDDGRSGKAEAR